MHSRWDDAEARRLEGLDLLVYASRLIGAETSLVVWGGGNTSIKTLERDHRGREVQVLRVKGSGSDLKSVQRKDFPGVRMDDILALLERDDMGVTARSPGAQPFGTPTTRRSSWSRAPRRRSPRGSAAGESSAARASPCGRGRRGGRPRSRRRRACAAR